eukprot:611933-Rhodomonas_salina.2
MINTRDTRAPGKASSFGMITGPETVQVGLQGWNPRLPLSHTGRNADTGKSRSHWQARRPAGERMVCNVRTERAYGVQRA